MRTSLIASMLTAVLVIGCSQAENKNALPKPTDAPTQTAAANVSTPAPPTTTPIVSNATAPPRSRLRNLPPEGGDKPTAAEVDGYPYSYKKDGEKTVATFDPKLLPWASVAAAVRDVINRSYGDKVTAAPRIEGTGSAQTISIAGSKHKYIIVPITEPTGEIRSLIITQLN
jgi:guanyl-specific ribonuclease Sa